MIYNFLLRIENEHSRGHKKKDGDVLDAQKAGFSLSYSGKGFDQAVKCMEVRKNW